MRYTSLMRLHVCVTVWITYTNIVKAWNIKMVVESRLSIARWHIISIRFAEIEQKSKFCDSCLYESHMINNFTIVYVYVILIHFF